MFKAPLMIIGLLVLSIVGLGGMGWWKLNQPIDPASEQGQDYAANFKAGISALCVGRVSRELGIAASGDELADMCDCTADMTYRAYKNEPPARLLQIADDPVTQKKMGGILQECADRAGVQ